MATARSKTPTGRECSPVAAVGPTLSRMNPWRAALTSATASGKSTRIASRSAAACSSGAAGRLHLLQRGGGELDGGAQRQRRELLALRLLDALRLGLRELAQPAEDLLGVTAQRKEATAFHAAAYRSDRAARGGPGQSRRERHAVGCLDLLQQLVDRRPGRPSARP